MTKLLRSCMPKNAWFIATPCGVVLWSTIRTTRSKAIEDHIANTNKLWRDLEDYEWPYFYYRGYRCVKAPLDFSAYTERP